MTPWADDTYANAINNSGQVAGSSSTSEGDLHVFITGPNGDGLRDLGAFGYSTSEALGINDAGRVVGVAYESDRTAHAFITGPNGAGMTDLNELVSVPEGVLNACRRHQ